MRYPIAAAVAHPAIGWIAGAMLMKPGVYRQCGALGARLGGSAVDLEAIAAHRRAGRIDEARARLAFARDARRFIATPITF